MDIRWGVFYDSFPEGLIKDIKYETIDRNRLTDFVLYDASDNDKVLLGVTIEKGERLVYRIRGSQDFSDSENSAKIYSIGIYDENDNLKVHNLVPDGRTFESDFWPVLLLRWIMEKGNPPELRPEEKKA